MSQNHGLSKETISALLKVFNQYPIDKVILYGSRAKGNFKDGSDIDITLVAPNLDLTQLLKIENEIDDLLLPYKVDLSLFHTIDNPDLILHIQKFGLPLIF